ncbi:MAG: type I methionyl aminopeptidase [Gammaproteobacteria bacterium GWE2_42_36]|nr:MAG: type I methionyl aminopeptidase [Gammaproteobacteria bacterium GWE2_42_36]
MNISIKTPEEIVKMRAVGRLAAEVLEMIEPHIKVGVTTETLDQLCHDYIVNHQKAIPAPLNYKGYPKSICASINHQICHGIPGPRKLKNGDIINLDITVTKEGYYGDTSKMFLVGKPSILAERLVHITYQCLLTAMMKVKPGAFTGDLGATIQELAETNRFSVVREYCGHGIGKHFHEPPNILHYGTAGTGHRLQPGMIFTIEPMINAGKKNIKLLPDGWTAVTKDHSLSAQWEHTLLVTETGCEVLTLRHEEIELAKQYHFDSILLHT